MPLVTAMTGPAIAACDTSGATVTCSGTTFEQNPPEGFGDGTQTGLTINVQPGASVTGSNDGLRLDSNNTINNSGLIDGQAGNGGIDTLGAVIVNNTATGVIRGGVSGINAGGDATITNAGSISGGTAGINANTNVTVVNSGTISGGLGGILALQRSNISNSGRISGANYGLLLLDTTTLTNSGTIAGDYGQSGAAIFAQASNNVFTFLPGSRIIGAIVIGSDNTVNIHTGGDVGWLLNFGSCGCPGLVGTNSTVTFTGGYGVVNGDRIATIDPTAFAYADRTLLDFSGALSSMLSGRLGTGAAGGATAFAATGSSVVAEANDAFANIPALAYANEGRIANAASYDRASGIGVWSRGFASTHHQNADSALLAAGTTSYGGIIGLDKMVAADLRLGAFVGAGEARLGVDRDSQTVKTNVLFAGLYGRKTFDSNAWGAPFLDAMMSAGRTGNDSRRLVASNMAPNGYETATGDYNGWFVSPELAYGIVMPLGGRYTLTPSARLRYLASHFDGYDETGSTQTLSVSGRTTHNLEQRAELALTYHGPGLRTTWTAGALAAERIGGGTIDTTLIGTPLSFTTPGDKTVFGVYGGFGVDVQITGATVAYVATQGTLTSDSARTALIQGGLRVAF